MKKTYAVCCTVMAALVCWSTGATAEVRLPSVIGKNMVIQRDIPAALWGWADPGEKIDITIENQHLSTQAGSDGTWRVSLNPMPAGGPHELTITGTNKITLPNIMAGDVWICSGQSNMEMRVRHVDNSDNEVADALHRNLRLFQITNDLSPEPRTDCEGRWEVCRPSTVGDFSAAGYFFGREVLQETDVPVGLINASWGGTTVEAWMSDDARLHCEEFQNLLDRWKPALEQKTQEILSFYRTMAEWEEDVHHVLYAGKPMLPFYDTPPESPVELSVVPQLPVWVHNGMIAPIVRYAIKGVIWYQGESNAGRAYQYRTLFPALIEDWRRQWNQGVFPFLFVQLANFGESEQVPSESAWAELREAQCMTLSLPNTAMAVAIDIGEGDDIHPRNKQDVGLRLAMGALKTVYGRDIVHSGPFYDSMAIKDGQAHLRFSFNGSGLVSKDGEPLKGFAIAGVDRKFVWAQALIKDNEVVVSNDDVQEPVAVRYGWANNPECNLYNREGLPASPFRTDSWPGITDSKK